MGISGIPRSSVAIFEQKKASDNCLKLTVSLAQKFCLRYKTDDQFFNLKA
jgi:hypothetical protein